MTPIEIFMIVLGLLIIIISFFFSDKIKRGRLERTQNNNTSLYHTSIIEEDNGIIEDKINSIISQSEEDIISRTDNTLSRISNEKIIMINDFSEQIIEKIKQNHQEVIFLYNMLNEKENQIKELLKEIDEKTEYSDKSCKKTKKVIKKQDKSILYEHVTTEDVPLEDVKVEGFSRISKQDNKKRININENTEKSLDQSISNHNEQILKFHNKGMNIMDISKTLDIGQGEVKLVIELYQEMNE